MGLRTTTAAELLGVSASTLRTWERRYGFPTPRRSKGGHRLYDRTDIDALREAYAETGHASSAVELARRRGVAPASCLCLHAALNAFDEDAADEVCAEALAARNVERVVEEVLLDGVESLPDGSPERALGLRWGAGWIAAQRRLAPPATLRDGVLVFDAAGPDVLHVAALELVLRRAGLRVLVLPVNLDPSRLQRAITALDPSLVVLGGRGASLGEVGRAVFSARRARGERVPVCDFRGATGAVTTVSQLGPGLLAARDGVMDLLREQDLSAAVPDVAPRIRRSSLRVAG